MILNELFNKSVELTDVVSNKKDFHTLASIGGRQIQFSAYSAYKDDGVWEVGFSELALDKGHVKTNHKMTGSGHEFEVMRFVMSSLEAFIKQKKPSVLSFSIDPTEESRLRLYKRMVSRYSKGYTVESGQVETDGDVVFTLTKKSRRTKAGD